MKIDQDLQNFKRKDTYIQIGDNCFRCLWGHTNDDKSLKTCLEVVNKK